MIGGFRKKAKRTNIRKKITTVGSDDDEEEGQIESDTTTQTTTTTLPAPVPLLSINFSAPVLPPTLALPPFKPKKEKLEKKSATKTSLSFGDELEKEDEFVLKRSKASLSLNEQVKREKKQKKKKDIQNSAKDTTKTATDTEIILLTQTGIPYNTNGIQFKNDIISIDDINPIQSKLNVKEVKRDNATHHFSIRPDNKAGGMPDAATIYAMKKRREQARQFGGQPNYIPLDSNKHEGRFKAGSSRLVREEMDDSSDEERIEMKGSSNTSHPALERRKQVAKALEEVNDDDAEGEKEDDELSRWEDEQMKKGSTIPTNLPEVKKYGPKLPDAKTMVAGMMMDPASFNAAMGLPTTTAYNFTPGLPQTTYAAQVFPSLYGATYTSQPPPAQKQIITIDLVIKRLQEQLDTKRQLFRLHEQQCTKTKFDLDSANDNIVSLERKAVDVSDKFSFFQDIRGYIKDLLECLQEKVETINELEDSMHQLLKKRSDKLTTRRQNDVKDEVDQVSGKMSMESERIANIKNRRIAEREGRRERRREIRRRRAEENQHHDGMSSDEEMVTADLMRFSADKEKILKESAKIFEDVVSDFTEIREVMNHFEQWKFAFSESYKQAFLGLCLPKLFTPYIKLEMLNWNPLETEGDDFEDLNWYISLILYGHHGGELDETDEDLKLTPNIIEKVLIVKLTVLIRDVWDPLSSKQTKLITFLFQRLVDDYPTITKESKTTKILVEAIVSRLSESVENEIYIPLYSRELLEAKKSNALTFLERQFWKGVKLLQNLMEWNWLLSQKNLLQLGVDAILNRYLIIALQQFPDPLTTLEKSKTVVNILPKEWFEKSDNIVAGMQSFARFLNGLASTVYKTSLGYSDQAEIKKMKMTIKKIISLLMHIQAFDEARAVANSFASRKVAEDSPSASPRSSSSPRSNVT